MTIQGSPLCKVKELKVRGNSFFRQNSFDRAATCYDEACKLMGLSLEDFGGEDIHSLSELAVFLNSNLAACALKLGEYRASVDLCSMILDTFPRNVKARFRRATAFMKLKRFLEAELDLVEALVVEPRNKDVLRELDVVKGNLLIKENGKRVLDVTHVCGMNENCKKPVLVPEAGMSKNVSESVAMEVMEDQSDMGMKDIEYVDTEVGDAQSTCGSGLDLHSNIEENEHISNKSVLEFIKKGGGNSRLRIPEQSYQKLLEGKKVSFYHKRDLSIMTIQILNVEATKERNATRECSKKKRRRRCSKKRKSKTVTMVENISPLNTVEVNHGTHSISSSVSSGCSISSSVASVGDNLSALVTQNCHENTKIMAHDPSLADPFVTDNVTSDPNDLRPFIFSACPTACKISSSVNLSCSPATSMLCRYPFNHRVNERKKIYIPKKNYSQRDESPRHNVSTFSTSRSFPHKFLRPRGVSVSCCRYSSEAQLIKKRKEMSVQLVNSDRPSKSLLRLSTSFLV